MSLSDLNHFHHGAPNQFLNVIFFRTTTNVAKNELHFLKTVHPQGSNDVVLPP